MRKKRYFFTCVVAAFRKDRNPYITQLVNMIIKYRLNLDQGKDQAQLKWPLPLTSARNRASDVHSSSLSSL